MSTGKYDRRIILKEGVVGTVDVYRILEAYGETLDPCLDHAIKKLLCAGTRGAKGSVQDKQEAINSIQESIKLEQQRKKFYK